MRPLSLASLLMASLVAASLGCAGSKPPSAGVPSRSRLSETALELSLRQVIPPSASYSLEVEAVVRNLGQERLCLREKRPGAVYAVKAELRDAAGQLVKGTHTWATKMPAEITYSVIEVPARGETVVDRWRFDPNDHSALGGGFHWDLADRLGQELTLEHSFTSSCERLDDPPEGLLPPTRVAIPPAHELFCGELKSKPVTLTIPG